jgi:hypothetical protein
MAGAVCRPKIRSAAFSAMAMTVALVLPLTTLGMMEASTTRNPSMPSTLKAGSTTAPMLQVLVG